LTSWQLSTLKLLGAEKLQVLGAHTKFPKAVPAGQVYVFEPEERV
jgi:hypothetical protein